MQAIDTKARGNSEQQAQRLQSWSIAEANDYLCGYPVSKQFMLALCLAPVVSACDRNVCVLQGKKDNPHLKANVEFYQNKRRSAPDGKKMF